MAVRDVPSAREAVTTFRVLERFEHGAHDDGYTLDRKLFTGRTHQIRVHMQYTKHPVVGDPVYDAHAPRDPEGRSPGWSASSCTPSGWNSRIRRRGKGAVPSWNGLPRDLCGALDAIAERSRGRTAAGDEVFALLQDATLLPRL